MANPYKYRGLRHDQIRLFSITAIVPEINIDLKMLTLTAASNTYHALSYTSKQLRNMDIVCIGRWSIAVTPRVHDALIELFKYGQSRGRELLLWVDDICLDQEDIREKNEQMALIPDIYSNALETFVYLGRSTQETDLAIQAARDHPEEITTLEGLQDQQDVRSQRILAGTQDLLSRPWFERLWVLQEAALSNSLIVGCGREWLDWDILADFLAPICPPIQDGPAHPTAFDPDYPIRRIAWLRKEIVAGRQILLPLVLGCMGGPSKCQEPIDRLWGMMGLMPPGERSYKAVNYMKTGRDELAQQAIKIMKWWSMGYQTVYMLSFASLKNKGPKYPNWCPDWMTCKQGPMTQHMIWLARVHQTMKAGPKCLPHGAPNQTPVKFDSNSNVLHARGSRMGQVAKIIVFPHVADRLNPTDEERARIAEWESECLNLATTTITAKKSHHYLWIMVGSLLYDIADKEIAQKLKTPYLTLKGILNASPNTVFSPKERSILQDFVTFCMDKAFFTTDGKRIAFGPADVRVGDKVCILYAGDPAWVLCFREGEEAEPEVELVGECYTHDVVTKKGTRIVEEWRDEVFRIV